MFELRFGSLEHTKANLKLKFVFSSNLNVKFHFSYVLNLCLYFLSTCHPQNVAASQYASAVKPRENHTVL